MHQQPSEYESARTKLGVPDLELATELTAAGFVQPVTNELRTDVANHLEGDYQRTIIVEGKEVGYAVFNQLELSVPETARLLYLRGIIIEPAHQGRHIAERVIDEGLVFDSFDLFGFRTQSSIMYAAVDKRFEEMYPALDGSPIPADVHRAGTELAGRIKSNFPLHKGCYGRPLYGEKPLHRDSDYQARFDQLCPGYETGDAVICVAKGLRGRHAVR